MKLLSIDEFIARSGERDLQDIRLMVGSALDITTTLLASALNCKSFDQQELTDVFYLSPGSAAQRNHVTALHLSRGFLLADSPVVVMTATTMEDLFAASIVVTPPVRVHRDKGLVQVLVPPAQMWPFVSVTYEAGFAISEETPADEQVLAGVPAWLKDIAYMAAFEFYVRQQETKQKEATKEWDKTSPVGLPESVRMAAQRYVRWAPTAFQPS